MSCASIALCLSVEDVVRWELMFDPTPVQRYAAGRASKRIAAASSDDPPRNAIASPPACNCTRDTVFEDLDPGHYPQRLLSVRCAGSQWCAEVRYPVLVLKETAAATRRQHEPRPHLVPADLRGRWTFVELNTVVGCSCPSA